MLMKFFSQSFRYLMGECNETCRFPDKAVVLTETEMSMLLPFVQFTEVPLAGAIAIKEDHNDQH